jgi:hypothetical protein
LGGACRHGLAPASPFTQIAGLVQGFVQVMSVQWCSNVLRRLAPHMWICRNLIDQVDRPALERVAHVSETNGVFKVVPRSGCSLEEL